MLSLLLSTLLATALAAPAAGGVPADDAACATCHEELAGAFAGTSHARVKAFEVGGGTTGCASCHGDVAKHLDSGDPADVRTFGKDATADSAACLDCHGARGMAEFSASAHAGEAGCTTCHSVHSAKKPDRACASCHADVKAQMRAPSHHPIPEGKMSCASCHDVHKANESALKTVERNTDLCLSCHPSQQGPFIFEHAPVTEDCMICHQPHGSTANNLLVANEPYLCLQCHEFHFHTGYRSEEADPVTVGGRPYPNVMGEHGYQQAFSTKCTQCHTKVHGTDLPSQGVPGRGQALTR
jgi:DmsE family decaheme c-type cytochrome